MQSVSPQGHATPEIFLKIQPLEIKSYENFDRKLVSSYPPDTVQYYTHAYEVYKLNVILVIIITFA